MDISAPFGSLQSEGFACYQILVVVVPRAGRPTALEALTAIHRLAWAWVEGNFRFLTALRACCRVECALTTAIAVAAASTISAAAVTTAEAVTIVALLLASLPARRASLWIGKSPRRVEILLTRREHKLVAAIATGKRSIAHVS